MTTGISFSIAALQDGAFNENKITFAYGAKYPQNEFLEESHLFQCQYQVTF